MARTWAWWRCAAKERTRNRPPNEACEGVRAAASCRHLLPPPTPTTPTSQRPLIRGRRCISVLIPGTKASSRLPCFPFPLPRLPFLAAAVATRRTKKARRRKENPFKCVGNVALSSRTSGGKQRAHPPPSSTRLVSAYSFLSRQRGAKSSLQYFNRTKLPALSCREGQGRKRGEKAR